MQRQLNRQIDRPIMPLNGEVMTMRDLLNGGVVILGRPGSGKTRFSGRILALNLMEYPNSGGLILSASPTDLEDWQTIARMTGRSNDLIVFGPGRNHKFNFVDFLAEIGCDSRDIAKAIITVGEAMDNDDTRSGGGEGDKFWPIKVKQTMETAVEIERLAEGRLDMANLHEFVITGAKSAASLSDPAWQDMRHNQSFAKAFNNRKTPEQKADYDNAKRYWQGEWPIMADKTRSSIEAGVTGIFHTFNSGLVRSLLSGQSTVTPKDMDKGKWIFVDTSVGQYGSSGAFILNAWRYAVQKYVLKRNPATWTTPIGIIADEAGKIVNSNDSFYLTESRKFGGYTVFLAQSMRSFQAALPGERGRALAEVLLGCFATKILHALGDADTAEWAAKLLGKEIKIHYGWSPGQHNPYDLLRGYGHANVNAHQHMEDVLQPKELLHNLRCGGPPDHVSDAYVIKTGVPFSDGNSFRFVSFPLV